MTTSEKVGCKSKGEICIRMNAEQCLQLLKAINAAHRWRSTYTDDYPGDKQNVEILSKLGETIAEKRYGLLKNIQYAIFGVNILTNIL